MSRLTARFDVPYRDFRLDVELDVPASGITAVYGPSGSGKTTFLRCLAGLERPTAGFMGLGSEVWQDEARGIYVPIAHRPIGYVFQEPRLFPHLNVRSNLLYGFKRTPMADRRLSLDRVVGILGIEHLLDRRPRTLSGGEKQRVAIGRALLTSPRLLLLDEPLASLDLPRKREILPFLTRLNRELNIPTVYVSHSVNEILQLADRVAVLSQGKLLTVGTVNDVFASLALRETIAPHQVGAVIDTIVAAHEPQFALTRLALGRQSLYVPLQSVDIGERLRVHILARDVSLALGPPTTPTSVLNILEARVTEIREGSMSADIRLDVGAPLVATVTRKSLANLALKPGQRLYAHIKAVALNETLAD